MLARPLCVSPPRRTDSTSTAHYWPTQTGRIAQIVESCPGVLTMASGGGAVEAIAIPGVKSGRSLGELLADIVDLNRGFNPQTPMLLRRAPAIVSKATLVRVARSHGWDVNDMPTTRYDLGTWFEWQGAASTATVGLNWRDVASANGRLHSCPSTPSNSTRSRSGETWTRAHCSPRFSIGLDLQEGSCHPARRAPRAWWRRWTPGIGTSGASTATTPSRFCRNARGRVRHRLGSSFARFAPWMSSSMRAAR